MRDWLVAADDRTGAFEVAALFAQVVGPVTVAVDAPVDEPCVVDIGTRAMPGADAAGVAAAIDTSPSTWIAHKIDSTLRGNWAAELLARQRATGRRVVVLPGWPELGRTCVGGVVFVDGVPIGNVRDQLAEAELIDDAENLRKWLDSPGRIAVCDVPDSDEMYAAARALAPFDVLVAGPAGPIGAAFAARHAPQGSPRMQRTIPPALVVCGSVHPVAREQLRRLRASLPEVEIIATDEPAGELNTAAIEALEARVRSTIERLKPVTLVVVGGDTAAELLGTGARLVGGFAAVGMPWSLRGDGAGPLVITKAGAFGGPDALVDLLGGENG